MTDDCEKKGLGPGIAPGLLAPLLELVALAARAIRRGRTGRGLPEQVDLLARQLA